MSGKSFLASLRVLVAQRESFLTRLGPGGKSRARAEAGPFRFTLLIHYEGREYAGRGVGFSSVRPTPAWARLRPILAGRPSDRPRRRAVPAGSWRASRRCPAPGTRPDVSR